MKWLDWRHHICTKKYSPRIALRKHFCWCVVLCRLHFFAETMLISTSLCWAKSSVHFPCYFAILNIEGARESGENRPYFKVNRCSTIKVGADQKRASHLHFLFIASTSSAFSQLRRKIETNSLKSLSCSPNPEQWGNDHFSSMPTI